jgi:hypothetical protein
LLVAACVVPSSPIFVTLMKEAPGSYETSVLTRAARRNNPEDTILQGYFSFPSSPKGRFLGHISLPAFSIYFAYIKYSPTATYHQHQ